MILFINFHYSLPFLRDVQNCLIKLTCHSVVFYVCSMYLLLAFLISFSDFPLSCNCCLFFEWLCTTDLVEKNSVFVTARGISSTIWPSINASNGSYTRLSSSGESCSSWGGYVSLLGFMDSISAVLLIMYIIFAFICFWLHCRKERRPSCCATCSTISCCDFLSETLQFWLKRSLAV